MSRPGNMHITQIIQEAERLFHIAEEGYECCEDDGCLLLNGVVRDCANQLRAAAERERRAHIEGGIWDGEQPEPAW